jgi:uncharacterized protein with von Willebrand factor type A (vWA) domain
VTDAESLEARGGSLIERVAPFCRALRERGVLATPAESIDAMHTLDRVDLGDREDVYHALRLLLTSRREDLPIFDELFAIWWRPAISEAAAHTRGPRAPRDGRSRQPPPKPAPASTISLAAWAAPNVTAEGEARIPAPSTTESRGNKNFASFGSEELEEVTRLARRLARRLQARPSRRWRASRQGGVRLDLRRTVRLSLKTGGDLVDLAHRERKLRRTKIVALCDVSGSMDLYSRFLLQFLYALQHAFARVETFAFSTRLVRITDALARDSYRAALDELASTESGWSGGTKIGASIAQFVVRYPRLVDRRTVVVLLSDGWDTGEPEVLSDAMSAIHRRAGRVVWLNPLLGSPTYQPLTRGMQAALPHVDVFAPAHNLSSLEALARHLAL